MGRVWHSGRESRLLDDIISGRKTIEGRINRGKFAEYSVGDCVRLRRDIRDASGELHDGTIDEIEVKITGIRRYSSFIDMVGAEGFEKVIPYAKDKNDAASEYDTYYSRDDQRNFGVLAIEIVFEKIL